MLKLQKVLESCLCVDDLNAAERFYANVLGLELLAKQSGRHLFFRCGQSMVLLFDTRASNDADSEFPRHGTHGAGHLAFAIADVDLDAWRQRLIQNSVAVEYELTWPTGGRSIYFRDPSGNCLEFATPALWGLSEEGC